MDIVNKTALITGASSGIGRAMAYNLAGRKANLILVARTRQTLSIMARDIRDKYDVQVEVYAHDLSKPGECAVLYEQIKKDKLTVHILVNNAGFGKWGNFEKYSISTYLEMIQLNIMAVTELCYLFLPDLKKLPESGIINVGSTASFLPVPYASVYAATKAYVLSLTEGLVGECRYSDIHITCLCPASTDTNFNNIANEKMGATMEHMQQPEEVAEMGIEAMIRNRHYVLTGRKLQIAITNLLSRKKVIKLVRNSWLKRINGES